MRALSGPHTPQRPCPTPASPAVRLSGKCFAEKKIAGARACVQYKNADAPRRKKIKNQGAWAQRTPKTDDQSSAGQSSPSPLPPLTLRICFDSHREGRDGPLQAAASAGCSTRTLVRARSVPPFFSCRERKAPRTFPHHPTTPFPIPTRRRSYPRRRPPAVPLPHAPGCRVHR